MHKEFHKFQLNGEFVASLAECGTYKGSEREFLEVQIVRRSDNFIAQSTTVLLTYSSEALWVSDCLLVATQAVTMLSASIVAHMNILTRTQT